VGAAYSAPPSRRCLAPGRRDSSGELFDLGQGQALLLQFADPAEQVSRTPGSERPRGRRLLKLGEEPVAHVEVDGGCEVALCLFELGDIEYMVHFESYGSLTSPCVNNRSCQHVLLNFLLSISGTRRPARRMQSGACGRRRSTHGMDARSDRLTRLTGVAPHRVRPPCTSPRPGPGPAVAERGPLGDAGPGARAPAWALASSPPRGAAPRRGEAAGSSRPRRPHHVVELLATTAAVTLGQTGGLIQNASVRELAERISPKPSGRCGAANDDESRSLQPERPAAGKTGFSQASVSTTARSAAATRQPMVSCQRILRSSTRRSARTRLS